MTAFRVIDNSGEVAVQIDRRGHTYKSLNFTIAELRPALLPETRHEDEWRLQGGKAWITADIFSINVFLNMDGLAVDVYLLGHEEDGCELESAIVHYADVDLDD